MDTRIKPALTGGSHTLPFEKLAPGEFERLCLWLVQREGYVRAEYLGEAGSERGRDVVAWKNGRRIVFQCKRVKAFTVATARVEIEKLRTLPVGEQPHELVFVVSQAVSAETRVATRTAWGDEDTCHFWSGSELDERIKRHPDLLKEFFQLPPEGSPNRGEDARGIRRSSLNWGIGLSLLGVALTLVAWLWPRHPERSPSPSPAKPAIYSVRVQVLDPQGRPVGNATVRASVGNEPQRLPDGWWEIEIPAAKVPNGGQVSFWAEHTVWEGNRVDLHLREDPNQRVEIFLKKPETWLRGIVVDGVGRGLAGARIFPKDSNSGEVITKMDGHFELKVPMLEERRVRLRAEKSGFSPGETFCFAGKSGCVIHLLPLRRDLSQSGSEGQNAPPARYGCIPDTIFPVSGGEVEELVRVCNDILVDSLPAGGSFDAGSFYYTWTVKGVTCQCKVGGLLAD